MTVEVAGEQFHLTREEATQLREGLDEAISQRWEFAHTIGEHRADGSYRVARRRADSTGNATIFDSPDELLQVFHELPDTFTATDVTRPGLSGSRRHLVIRHMAEHPAFACDLVREQPLTARKRHQ